jgi:ribonuclease P protein component
VTCYKFPKEKRLRKKKQFQYVFDNQKRAESRDVRLYFTEALATDGAIGFIIKKSFGCAVFRNKCRRILKEIYRLNQHELTKEYDFIVVLKRPLKYTSFERIKQNFISLLKKSP